jgi:membrane-associated protease RseP (regulator of RpoE activity)
MAIQIGTLLFLGLVLYLVLVVFHMLGHLLASRALNIGIEVASFGIGPKLFRLWRTKLLMRIP